MTAHKDDLSRVKSDMLSDLSQTENIILIYFEKDRLNHKSSIHIMNDLMNYK